MKKRPLFTALFIVSSLSLFLIALSMIPRKEGFAAAACPPLDLSISAEPATCLELLPEEERAKLTPEQSQLLASMEHYRFETTQRDRLYGTNQCIVPMPVPAELCSPFPTDCPGLAPPNSSATCLLTPTPPQLNQFLNHAEASLNADKKETIATSQTANVQREVANQRLREETIQVEQETRQLQERGTVAQQDTAAAQAQTAALASSQSAALAKASQEQLRATQNKQRSSSLVEANPHIFSRKDAPPTVPPFTPKHQNIRSELRHNFCLDTPGASRGDNVQFIMWSCHNGHNQKFNRDAQGRIQVVHAGKCLAVQSPNNGTPVVQQTCSGAASQQWTMDEEHRLRPKSSPSRCLDIAGADSRDGARLILWDCHNGKNQKWYL